MSVEGAAMYMESGDCLLMRPAETHAMHINPEQPYERMALLFSDSVFSGQLAPLAARLDTYKHARVCRSDDFIRCCLELIVNAADSERRAVIVSMLGAIISRLSQSSSPVERPDIYGHDRLTGEIIAFVNEHLFCDWNLDTLAAALYRDKSYLNRHFKSAVGTTICDYAKKKRLHRRPSAYAAAAQRRRRLRQERIRRLLDLLAAVQAYVRLFADRRPRRSARRRMRAHEGNYAVL